MWRVFTGELLSIPHVWSDQNLCPILEIILGLNLADEKIDADSLHKADDVKSNANLSRSEIWHNILRSSSFGYCHQQPNSCDGRRPFATMSHTMYASDTDESAAVIDSTKFSPSLGLVNNFFEYAIHHHPSLLQNSPRSTHLWIDILSKVLSQDGIPLVAAIDKYHGVGSEKFGGIDDEDEEDGDNRGHRRNVGSRDVVNTILEDCVNQTRHQVMRQALLENHNHSREGEFVVHDVQHNDSKRQKLQSPFKSEKLCSSKEQPPSVHDTLELLNHICNPIVISSMAEFCSSQLDSVMEKTHVEQQQPLSSVDVVLKLLSVLLVYSPSGTGFSSSSISSKILSVFAFGPTRQALIKGLWKKIQFYVRQNPIDYVHQFVCPSPTTTAPNVRNRNVLKSHDCELDQDSELSASGTMMNKESSSLMVMLCVLSHQLLAVDDEEFTSGKSVLELSEVCELVELLKNLMFEMYWTTPLLTVHENSVVDNSNNAVGEVLISSNYDIDRQDASFLKSHLYNLQMLFIATKVFNQLSVRNERIHFLPRQGWLWKSAIGNSELEVLDDDENPFLDQRRSRSRMVLLLCPQVIGFSDRAAYFQKLIQNDRKKVGHSIYVCLQQKKAC